MSLNVHQRDNICVKAHCYKTEIKVHSDDSQFIHNEDRNAFHIDISFLINWKIKEFWWRFILDESDEHYWVFLDWTWNSLHVLITKLWYDLWESDIITEWIYHILDNQ